MRFLFVFMLCAWTVPAFAARAAVYHVSDVHGFFYSSHGKGGYAALAAVLAGEPLPYILLDGGDFSNGAPEAARSRGRKSVRLMNAVGVSAATLGNHEFYFGDGALDAMLGAARFPVLAANLVDTRTGGRPPLVRPWRVFRAGRVRLGVIGLATTRVKSGVYALTDGARAVADALAVLAPVRKRPLKGLDSLAELARLRRRPAAVILLAHNSPDNPDPGGRDLLARVPELFPGRIQVVLGGHLHQRYIRRSGGVLYVESGSGLQGVSRVEIETDDATGAFVSASARFIPLYIEQTGEDRAVGALADSLREPGLDAVIGTAAERLAQAPREGELDAPLGNWLADLFRAHTGAEVFIHNTGAMRKDMEAGPFTYRDLAEMFPYDNQFVMMEMPGSLLKEFVRTNLLPYPLYQFSGLTAVLRQTPDGVRADVWVNGAALEENRLYRIAVNAYVAAGKNEGSFFNRIAAESKRVLPGKTMKEVMTEGLRARSPVRAPRERRVMWASDSFARSGRQGPPGKGAAAGPGL